MSSLDRLSYDRKMVSGTSSESAFFEDASYIGRHVNSLIFAASFQAGFLIHPSNFNILSELQFTSTFKHINKRSNDLVLDCLARDYPEYRLC